MYKPKKVYNTYTMYTLCMYILSMVLRNCSVIKNHQWMAKGHFGLELIEDDAGFRFCGYRKNSAHFSSRECKRQMDLIKDLVQLKLVSTLRKCILRIHIY